MNQDKFNFNISKSQFFIGIMMTPLVFAFSLEYDDTSAHDPLGSDDKDFNKFFEDYFAKGMPCIFSHGG
jgi:hypothetical protein